MSEHRNVLDTLRLLTVGMVLICASAACDRVLEVSNPGDVTEWATDHDFRIRACVALDPETLEALGRALARRPAALH